MFCTNDFRILKTHRNFLTFSTVVNERMKTEFKYLKIEVSTKTFCYTSKILDLVYIFKMNMIKLLFYYFMK